MAPLPAANPFFLDVGGPAGRRFGLLHRPAAEAARGAVLYVHPFAEEMNKARRMAALQARALAGAGFAVLQLDLLGCGDSAGDFADATWDRWVDDVVAGARWLAEHVEAPLTLWGLRTGALLAAEAARRAALAADFLFWQPTPTGKPALQQFLRLALVKEMLEGQSAGSTARLRERLAAGETIEIAGYALAPGLAEGLERAALQPPAGARAVWLETSTREEPELLPASAAALERWKAAGAEVSAAAVAGPAFWAAAEIEEAPALLDATLKALVERADARCPA